MLPLRCLRSLVFLIVLTSAACAKDDPPTAGPDIVTVRPVGRIQVTVGDAQQVGPGDAVAVAPQVLVANDQGRPMSGVVLSLDAQGGGRIAASSVTTDASGTATLPRWVAPVVAGPISLVVSGPASGTSPSVTATITATVVTPASPIVSQTIGPAGGTITISNPASALNGLTITVPPAAVRTPTVFTIQASPAVAVPVGTTAASPLIEVAAGGITADSAMTIRLPALSGSGANGGLALFVLDRAGRITPVPLVSRDTNSVTASFRGLVPPSAGAAMEDTFARSRAGGIQFLALWRAIPVSGTYGIGFATGRDNAEFVNYGSFWQIGGYCAGSSVLAGGWFVRPSPKTSARARFPALLTNSEMGSWQYDDQLNPAIRLATELQSSYGWNVNTIGWWKTLFGSRDRQVWENVLDQFVYGHGEPVYVAVSDGKQGHAVLAHQVDVAAGTISVADPNFPEDGMRIIRYSASTERFAAFPSAPNASAGNSVSYTEFADATDFFRTQRSAIDATINQYLNGGLRSKYQPVRLRLQSDTGTVLADSDTIRLTVRGQDLELSSANLSGLSVEWVRNATSGPTGTVLTAPTDVVRIPLSQGLNTIGMVFWQLKNSTWGWYDAKVLLVTREFTPVTAPNPTGGNTGSTFGDPHLRTFDGRGYAFMAVGDYVLNRSTVSGDNFQVQVRYRKLGTQISVNDAFAAAVGSDTVNVYHTPRGFDVIINDSTFTALTTFSRALSAGGAVSVANGRATISWPDRSTLSIVTGGAYLHLPFARSGKVEGLLGNYDGNSANDVRTPAGTVVDARLTELYGDFRRGWRVPFGTPTSLFKRGPDLYDANFPMGLVRLQDLDPVAVAAARVKCRAAGVVSQEVEDDCAFDIVVSGDNSWANVARQFDPGVARVLVGPAVAYTQTGQTVQFAAASQGLGNASVRWTTSGGTITSTGVASATFTAPSTPGTYTVTALSEQTATVASSATVFVTAPNQPSGGLSSGQNHTGRISAPGEEDTWTFTASQSETIILSIAETAGDADFTPWIRLYAPSGALIQDAWDNVATQHWRSAPETGTYRLVVGSRDGGNDATGDYRLVLVKIPGTFVVPAGDEGGPMTNGANSTGSIAVGDLDVWSFTAAQGEALMLAMSETRGDADFTPWMRLFAPDGSLVQDSWDNTATQHWRTAPTTGTYTVVIGTRDGGVDATGDYKLILAKAPGPMVVPAGDEGGAITNGENHTGRITLGDLDLWTFSAVQGEALMVAMAELSGDAEFTPWIRLFAPNGNLVQDVWDNTATQHWRTAPSTGTYTLVVGTRDVGLDATGQYQLILAKAPGAHVVPTGDEGGAMTTGENHRGRITVGDLDLWTFSAAQGEAIILAMSEVRGDADFTPWIRLFAPNGNLVQDAWDNTATQHWRTAPVTGTYTVVVGTRDGGLDATGDYTLILAKAPGTFVVPAGDEGGPMTNGRNHSGSVSVGDLDLWSFSATAGDAIMLAMSEVRGDATFTPWIRLFGPNGDLVQDGWDNTAVQHWRTAPSTGTYTLVVGTRDGGLDATGDYRLTLARIPGSFSVDAGDEGGSMSVTGNNAGTIRVGDLDIWTFSATQGGTLTLTLSEASGDADFTPWMRVFGPTGVLLGDVWDNATTMLTRTVAATGTHYVVVSTRDGGLDAQGTYTLSIAGTGISPRVGPVTSPIGRRPPHTPPAPRAPQ